MALHERHSCTVQLGGTDQWEHHGRSLAKLIRRVRGAVYGMPSHRERSSGSELWSFWGGLEWRRPSESRVSCRHPAPSRSMGEAPVQNEVLSGKLVLFGRFIIVRSGKKSYRGATLA